jgi:hypothetical protein
MIQKEKIDDIPGSTSIGRAKPVSIGDLTEDGLVVKIAEESMKGAGSSPSDSSTNSLERRGRLPCKSK